ncbi:MAG: hypothetical protein HY303_09210 [Candidatus Wallbacteria bacterium]|nr:hypothetical protein [Candidatus Wallbacteria bacterium]
MASSFSVASPGARWPVAQCRAGLPLAAALLGCLLDAGACLAVDAVDTLERVFTVGGAPRITVTHVAGIVKITGQAAPTVSIRASRKVMTGDATRGLARVKVELSGTTGEATVQVVHTGVCDWEELKGLQRQGQLDDVHVDLEMLVPQGASLDVATVSGEVVVTGITGGTSVRSVSSLMLLERVSGGVKVMTIGGEVNIFGLAGGLSAQSVNGPIKGRVMRGSCVVDTVSGAVELDLEPSEYAVARINTMSGSVSVAVPDRSGGSLDLKTVSGTVGGVVSSPAGPGPHHVTAHLGRDGPDITVQTVNGAIVVKRKKDR